MVKEQFSQIIGQNPSNFSSAQVKLLQDLVAHFPYFQGARALLAQHLFQTSNLHFKDQLAKLALQTGKRSHLYALFAETEKVEKPQLIEVKQAVEINAKGFTIIGKIEEATENTPIISDEPDLKYDAGTGFDIEKMFGDKPLAPPKKSRTIELIEGFLQKAPTKTSHDIQQAETRQIDQSLEVPEDLVSETLAKIYIKQEKFALAIKVYEKLLLLEPEKKTKFARLIDELKEKLK